MTGSPDAARAQALGRFLKDRMQADQVDVLSFTRLSGGAIQDNHALMVQCRGGPFHGTHALVVRSDAPSKVAASMPRAQEFQVLQVAHEAGVTVPRPLWMCEDLSVLGVPFCIMAKVEGSASGRSLVKDVASKPEQGRALVRQLGNELARVHGISPVGDAAARLSFLSPPAGSHALRRIGQYRNALDAIPFPRPVLEWALNWLEDHAVDSGLRTLVHGDFRTGNYMVADGRITAILDWEFASWGDPYEDLGWLCARSWRFAAPAREVGGVGERQALYEAWEAGTGQSVEDRLVRYWEVMGMVRWAVIALQQGQRHLSGEQRSLELALTGAMLPEIELDILAEIANFDGRPLGLDALNSCRSSGCSTGLTSDEPAFTAPDGGELLATARHTLLDQLLPQLSGHCRYEALMVANAMAIAMREFADRGAQASAASRAIHDFLLGLSGAPLGGDPRHALVRRLRGRSIGEEHGGRLRQLLLDDTCARLSLSNPKFLAGYHALVAGSPNADSGD